MANEVLINELYWYAANEIKKLEYADRQYFELATYRLEKYSEEAKNYIEEARKLCPNSCGVLCPNCWIENGLYSPLCKDMISSVLEYSAITAIFDGYECKTCGFNDIFPKNLNQPVSEN